MNLPEYYTIGMYKSKFVLSPYSECLLAVTSRNAPKSFAMKIYLGSTSCILSLHNEKNHSIKHGGGDIAKYRDPINMSCETPEDGHKFWVREPGGNTDQGPEAALSMMQHSLRQEATSSQCLHL